MASSEDTDQNTPSNLKVEFVLLYFQFQHVNGGPIIAVQIENEFGAYSSEVEHLMYLKKVKLSTFRQSLTLIQISCRLRLEIFNSLPTSVICRQPLQAVWIQTGPTECRS